jgi:hypothetical protein
VPPYSQDTGTVGLLWASDCFFGLYTIRAQARAPSPSSSSTDTRARSSGA